MLIPDGSMVCANTVCNSAHLLRPRIDDWPRRIDRATAIGSKWATSCVRHPRRGGRLPRSRWPVQGTLPAASAVRMRLWPACRPVWIASGLVENERGGHQVVPAAAFSDGSRDLEVQCDAAGGGGVEEAGASGFAAGAPPSFSLSPCTIT